MIRISRSLSITQKGTLALKANRTLRRLNSTLNSIEDHDIISIGGGPVGLALAAALAANRSISSTNKITVIEGSALSKVENWTLPPTEYSNRVSSVTSDNQQFLDNIGVWKHVDLSRTRPIEEMQVWDGLSSARITFEAPYATTSATQSTSSIFPSIEPMATLVENLHLQRALLKTIREQQTSATGGVELLDGVKVLGISPGEGGWPVVKVEGKDGAPPRHLRARLLIGADGYNSPVRTYSSIGTFGWAYNANGVVASVRVAEENRGDGMTTAWQRFLPQGPIAFLPMSDTVASLVWSTTPEIVATLKTLPLEIMPSLINAAFTLPYPQLSPLLALLSQSPTISPVVLAEEIISRTSHLTFSSSEFSPSETLEVFPPSVIEIQPGSVAAFPLKLSHADTYLGLPTDAGVDRRTCLVGDAAHTVHPMAGQGMNMGLGDVRALVDTLEKVVENGGDVGSFNSLRPYPRSRYIANHAVLSATDHLSTLYSSQSPLIIWARSTGLEIINEFDSLKSLIMGQAGGNAKGEEKRRQEGGGWGTIVDGMEGVVKGAEMAKMMGQMVGQQVLQKVMQAAGTRGPK